MNVLIRSCCRLLPPRRGFEHETEKYLAEVHAVDNEYCKLAIRSSGKLSSRQTLVDEYGNFESESVRIFGEVIVIISL